MIVKNAVLSLVEQVISSAFTFFLFFTATRMLSDESLSLYTAYFTLNQSFAFFLFGLVLLPVSSAAGDNTANELGISLVLLAMLLVVFSIIAPLAMCAFASFAGKIDGGTWALAVTFFAAQCCYETARWLCIRLRGTLPAMTVTFLRFALFFVTIIFLGSGRLDATRFVMIQICANLAATLFYASTLRRFVNEVRLALPDRSALRHLATFGNSLASFLINFAVVTLVNRSLGGGGLAAFQAMRSATNPIGLISQVLDNHFSAELARSGRQLEWSGKSIWFALIVAGLLIVSAVAFGTQVTEFLFVGKFGEYWLLLPLLLMASLSHALTRPVFVKWRIRRDTRLLNLFSFTVVAFVLPLLLIAGLGGFTYLMILIFALLPITALAIDLWRSSQAAE